MAIDYTRRDFSTIKDDLLRRAEVVLPEWTDRDTSDFGMLFVDLWSYMGDVLHYYIDRANKEAFLPTATRRESVLAFANLLDYIPNGRTYAIGSVTLSNSSTTSSYTLPQYSVLRGTSSTNQVTCYTASDLVIPASSSATVTVYEGSLIFEDSFDGSLGVSNGTPSQRFAIPSTDVVANSVQLFVSEDGVNTNEYRRVHSISDAIFGERVFATYTDATGTTQVLLGTAVNGFIPPVNSRLTVRYAKSSGADGNYGSNVITGFQTSVPATINIVSSTAFVGGIDEESIESMRASIPLATRTQDRAVTLQDFIDITLGVPGVYKAAAAYNSGSVTVYAVPAQSGYTTNTAASIPIPATSPNNLKADIEAELVPKALLGVTVSVAASTTLVPVNIAANVYVNSRYVSGWVIADVQAALNNLFEFDSVSYGQTLSLSDVYRTIVDVEGVDYAEIDPRLLGTFSIGTPTSTSSVSLGTGTAKTFTVAAGLGFVAGQTVTAYNSPTTYMTGTVTSYSSTTLVMYPSSATGSGTFTSWTILSQKPTLTSGDYQLFRKGSVTLYAYGGITASA